MRRGDPEWIAFLQWALPKMGLRWRGFRKVRGQVNKRIARRMTALSLTELAQYRHHLDQEPSEWSRLDEMCRISISRFYRDRRVFDTVRTDILPTIAARGSAVRCWSAGCASGEEPYTLRLIWDLDVGHQFPSTSCAILGTDAATHMLDRARRARYSAGTLRELSTSWIERGFTREALVPEGYF